MSKDAQLKGLREEGEAQRREDIAEWEKERMLNANEAINDKGL